MLKKHKAAHKSAAYQNKELNDVFYCKASIYSRNFWFTCDRNNPTMLTLDTAVTVSRRHDANATQKSQKEEKKNISEL